MNIGIIKLAIILCFTAIANQGFSQTKNVEIVKKWHEIVDSKEFGKLSLVEEDSVKNINPSGGFTGIEAHKQMMTVFATAFPNYEHKSSNYVANGNIVAFEGTFSGEHTGPFRMGESTIPATNKKVVFNYSGFITISENNKVKTIHFYFDSYSFLKQLGIL